MKKMIIALVAMVMMAMSTNAQSNDNNGKLTFDRLASYLELTINQMEPAKTAMAQFERSMEAYYQLQNVSKNVEVWENIQTRHKQTMKKVLTEKQYNKYVNMFDLTVKNAAERLQDQQLASR